jgi:large subunit ribosomal protein L6
MIKGPKGSFKHTFPAEVKIAKEGDHVQCSIGEAKEKRVRALFGLVRAMVQNMVVGVSQGYTRELEVVGIGYKAKQDAPNKVTFTVGYAHQVTYESPQGVSLKVETAPNKILVVVSGIDKQAVGQVAAEIRGIKPPEPYKGTGIKYANEVIKIKEGKKLAA